MEWFLIGWIFLMYWMSFIGEMLFIGWVVFIGWIFLCVECFLQAEPFSKGWTFSVGLMFWELACYLFICCFICIFVKLLFDLNWFLGVKFCILNNNYNSDLSLQPPQLNNILDMERYTYDVQLEEGGGWRGGRLGKTCYWMWGGGGWWVFRASNLYFFY